MPDVFTKAKRSEVMAAVRSRGNKATELALAAILRGRGITGWRRHQALPGCPDFVFRPLRLAVFVDGCFWHACPRHHRMPAGNAKFWRAKFERNTARDKRVNALLRARGWRVLRVWEHDLRRVEYCAGRIETALAKQRAALDGNKWRARRALR